MWLLPGAKLIIDENLFLNRIDFSFDEYHYWINKRGFATYAIDCIYHLIYCKKDITDI